MKCRISINMDNEAFDDKGELARILHALAKQVDGIDYNENLDAYDRQNFIKDSNGNTVGHIDITGVRT